VPSRTILLKILLLLCLSRPVFAAEYETYCNDRFGFCVDYSVDFEIEPAPENNDGRVFYNQNGFSMTVSGSNNALEANVDSEIARQATEFDRVTYRQKKADGYALSGYSGHNILYVRGYVGVASLNTLYLRYPSQSKADYDVIVTHIVKSFQPGDLDAAH